MHEVNGPFDSVSSNSSYTYVTPKVKRVTVTESEYDENGNIVKETVTETEYFDYTYQPAPYQPYTWTSTWGGTTPNK